MPTTDDTRPQGPEDLRSQVEASAQELRDQVAPPAGATEPPGPVSIDALTREDLMRSFRNNEYGDADLAVMLFRTRFIRDNSTGFFFRWQDHRWHRCRNREHEGEFRELADLYGRHAAAITEDIREAEARAAVLEKDSDEEKAVRAEISGLKMWRKNFNGRANALRGTARVRNVLSFATAGAGSLGISGENWNLDYRLLPVANGVVDLETGKLRDGRWDDWFNAGSPVEYKGYNYGGDFVPALVNRLLCGDEEVVRYFEMMLGFCSTGVQTKDFFVMFGPLGWNGKSVLFEWVARVLGDFAATLPVEMIYEDRFGRDPDKPSPQKLRLRGLRMAIMTEPEKNKRLSVSKVKSLTSAVDKIEARTLNDPDVKEFYPTHTLIMHGNVVPQVVGHQGPFYDRLRMIPFRARFVRDPAEVDPSRHIYLQKSRVEMDNLLREHDAELLSYLVRCARQALNAGDMPPPPEAVIKETLRFRHEEDLVGRYLRQCTKELPNAKEQAKDVYRSFCYWCREELGLTSKQTPSQKSISADLSAQPHIERDDTGARVYYIGVQVQPDWIPAEDWK